MRRRCRAVLPCRVAYTPGNPPPPPSTGFPVSSAVSEQPTQAFNDLYSLGCCRPASRKETKKTPGSDIHHHDLSKSDAIPLPMRSASLRMPLEVWVWLTDRSSGPSIAVE